jgi:hypothetical protein
MIALAGLKDDYTHDGRVLIELLDDRALPRSLRRSEHFVELAQVYKQLNAPLGSVGLNSLRLANKSILGTDATHGQFLGRLPTLRASATPWPPVKSLLAAAATISRSTSQGNNSCAAPAR